MPTMASNKSKVDYMSKKIPVNPKYKDVKPVTDTGASLSKHLEKIDEIKLNYKYRKDELFRRMKVTTLVQLMVQVAEFNHDFSQESNAEEQDPDVNENEAVRSTMQSVISGYGEIDARTRERAAGLPSGGGQQMNNSGKQLALEVPYLLLDVREPDEFEQCHLTSAISYPTTRLSRAVNYETQDLLNYKNKEGRIIVIYDDDEKMAPKAAQTFVERGYDNLFMLSGGLKVALQRFPIGLLFGCAPRHLTAPARSASLASTRGKAPSFEPESARMTSGATTATGGRSEFGLHDLSALKMALEDVMAPPEQLRTGRMATAASVGAAQRANIKETSTARKQKLVAGEWKPEWFGECDPEGGE